MVATGNAEGRLAAGSAVTARPALRARLMHNIEAEQERWFLWLPVMFGIGIALYFALPVEPWTFVALLPPVAALALRYGLTRAVASSLATAALLAIALGFAAAKLRTEAMRAPVLERQVGPVTVTGFVELVEPRATKGQRVTLRVVGLESTSGVTTRTTAVMPGLVPAIQPSTGSGASGSMDPGDERRDDAADSRRMAHSASMQSAPSRIRLRVPGDAQTLRPGDAVRVRATLSPPPGPSLPGDHDFARSAWFSGLGAVGFAVAAPEPADALGAPPAALAAYAAIARVRQAIGQRIAAALPGEVGAVANALITGERGGISEATNQAFRDSGLFHILSISGLHMVIMAGAVFFVVRLVLAAIPPVALRYPIKKWAALGAMAGALAYLLISGAAFATVRSYIMISIMFLAVLLDRPAMALRNVALAALLILLLWPESLLDAGFQMSFAAVVALVSAYEWLRAWQPEPPLPIRRPLLRQLLLFLGGIVTSTLVASLAVAPFGIYHFHNTQQFAILANLLAIPICNLVVMPAALAALVLLPFGLEAWPLAVMGWGIAGMMWCAERVAALPGAVGRVPAIPTLAFALMVIGGLWWALWSRRWRLLGLVPIAAGAMLAPTATRPDVLVGREAGLVAVRGSDGLLSVLAGRGGHFEIARWLEHDGDARPPALAATALAFRCDRQGCTAHVKGRLLAVPQTPGALRDDCAAAQILILKLDAPAGCRPPGVMVDAAAVRREGAHALYVSEAGVRVETVAQSRGARPWAPRPHVVEDAAAVLDDSGRGRR